MSLRTLIAGIVASVLALMLGAGFVLPSQVHVERAITIDAEPLQVFAHIGDLGAWADWSPWAEYDPNAMTEIVGAGVGQTMTWASENPQVGAGTQEIVAIEAPHYLKTHLHFGDRGESDAIFQLFPEEGKTRVVWSLDTDMRQGVPFWQQPINTYLGLAMDSLLGKDYEKGLQNLKTLLES